MGRLLTFLPHLILFSSHVLNVLQCAEYDHRSPHTSATDQCTHSQGCRLKTRAAEMSGQKHFETIALDLHLLSRQGEYNGQTHSLPDYQQI